MQVDLLYHTPLWVCAKAIRKCWASEEKSDTFGVSGLVTECGPKDRELIDRIANKKKHKSVLRHLNYTFDINNFSTKTLLAFTRHKAGVEFSVQSTRYTTSKRQSELGFTLTSNPVINNYLQKITTLVNDAINSGASNDDIAMLLPQAYEYSAVVTMNAQAIQHFLLLRTKPDAHYDIRELAYKLFDAIPDEHKYLFKDFLYENQLVVEEEYVIAFLDKNQDLLDDYLTKKG